MWIIVTFLNSSVVGVVMFLLPMIKVSIPSFERETAAKEFASLWKLWFEFFKYLQARSGFLVLLSFQWLFNLILKEISLLPTYCGWQVCIVVSKWGVNFYSLIGEKFWTFCQFCNFWRCLFSKLVDSKCCLFR